MGVLGGLVSGHHAIRSLRAFSSAAAPQHAIRSIRAFSSAADALQASNLRVVRGTVRLAGPGLLHFLQGLVTNNVELLEPPDAKPLYACILTPLGRYAHDMVLFRDAGSVEPVLLVDTDRRGKDDLISLLKRYRMHQRAITIDDVSEEYSSWAMFGAGDPPRPAAGWHQDPRLPELGLRAVLPSAAGAQAAAAAGAREVPWREFRRWRIMQGVAEGDSEIPSGEAIPLEYNVAALNGVKFDKGCYIGQEAVARIQFKGVVRKRLMPFSVDSTAPGTCCLDPGSKVCDIYDAAGALESVGTVRAREGDVGLAHLKLSAGLVAAGTGEPLYVKCGGAGEYVLIRPWRPSWWPPEWGTAMAE